MCACSWRVPFTAGAGPLSIVASQDLGDLGPDASAPAIIHWRWYHHFPSLGLGVLLVALLFLPKFNRCAQAWLILLPVLAVSLAWSMVARLLFLSVEVAESFGGVLVALAASWAAVWLLAPWIARRRIVTGLVLAMVVMLAGGGVYFFSVYDLGSADEMMFPGVTHLVGALALLSATGLSAFNCRRKYQPRRYMAWLLLWTMAAATVLVVLNVLLWLLGPMIFATIFDGSGAWEMLAMLVMALVFTCIAGGLLGVAIYLVNLPFLLLATRNPFYRDRFHDVLRLASDVDGPANAAANTDDVSALDPRLVTLAKES